MVFLITLVIGFSDVVRVRNSAELLDAVRGAKPGRQILLEPGEYKGGVHIGNLHGKGGNPIVIAAVDPKNPPVFEGGGSALQFSDVTYVDIRDLTIRNARNNGLNIDDGGSYDTPSHHINLKNIRVSDLPQGNNDGIKLSGLDDFTIENCSVERWGGSGIDMVGCHRGKISGSTFRTGGSSGIQMKGGTSSVTVRRNTFDHVGERAVNIGGSTGMPYFRPAIESIPAGRRYEAKDIVVEGNTFAGSMSPIAFVGVDGALVRFNTIYRPGRWAIRILQETNTPDFVPSRNGVFESNLIVFRSDSWASGGVNVGGGTEPSSFRFAKNFWFCEDRADRSKPSLPTAEMDGVYGKDPQFIDSTQGDFRVKHGSPARQVGTCGFRDKAVD